MRLQRIRVLAAVFVCALALGAVAQDKGDGGQKLSSRDRSFILQANSGGMVEIELSKAALQSSATADVKAFAQHIVRDHEKAGAELQEISTRLGAAPPKAAAPQKDLLRFAQLKGAEFDKAYVERMVRDHTGAIALFEKQAESGSSEALKQFAGKTVPALKEHLKMAMGLAEKAK